MTQEIVRELIDGVWTTTYASQGGGGGSQPFVRIPIAFDMPNIHVETFAITAVGVDPANTFTIAGDHAALFPPGFLFTVAGSTLNDGIYTVVTAVFGSATVITVEEAVADATVDGTVTNDCPNGDPVTSSGIVLYTPTPGDIWLPNLAATGFSETTPWDGSSPTGFVFMQGTPDYTLSLDFASPLDLSIGDTPGGDGHLSLLDNICGSTVGPVRFNDATPLMLVVTDGSGGDPGSTAGEGEIVLFIVAAP